MCVECMGVGWGEDGGAGEREGEGTERAIYNKIVLKVK